MKRILILLIPILFTVNINAQWLRCKGLYSEMSPNSCIVAHKNLIFAGSNVLNISYDFGENWSIMNNVFVDNFISSITSFDNKFILAATNDGIYFSSNDGSNWIKRDAGISQLSVSCLAKCGDRIFAGTDSGLFVSLDLGNSWSQINSTLPHERVSKIVTQDESILVKLSDLYLSTDSGISWNLIDTKLLDKSPSTFSLSYNKIVVGTWQHIYISSNLGENWDLVSDSIPDDFITSIVTKDNFIFAGTYHYGIYFSDDLGQNWTADTGRPIMINFLSICNDYIFAETYGGGTYRAKLSDFGITHNFEKINDTDILISPNPASDYIEIFVGLGSKPALTVGIRIYDILGMEITTPSLRDTPPYQGGEIVRFDISNLSPGIYFVLMDGKIAKFVKI